MPYTEGIGADLLGFVLVVLATAVVGLLVWGINNL